MDELKRCKDCGEIHDTEVMDRVANFAKAGLKALDLSIDNDDPFSILTSLKRMDEIVLDPKSTLNVLLDEIRTLFSRRNIELVDIPTYIIAQKLSLTDMELLQTLSKDQFDLMMSICLEAVKTTLHTTALFMLEDAKRGVLTTAEIKRLIGE